MSKIKIKNFGPIKEGFQSADGFMDIKKVTVFIGSQGGGKSTVAKLISTFSWMEKALNRGDFKIKIANDIITRIQWHGLDDYFEDNTEIKYEGKRYCISYDATTPFIPFKVELIPDSTDGKAKYVVPKIVYVPAERNFLSTIKEAFDLSGLPDPLSDFSTELRKAQNSINGTKVLLPVNGVNYDFNRQEGLSYISGDGFRLNLLKASSGFHSLVPLYLVLRYLTLKVQKEHIPELADVSPNNRVKRDEEISAIWAGPGKHAAGTKHEIDRIYAKYHNKCVVSIVEEPEQNLYPESQREVLNSLLELNNVVPDNQLIMTTHSPYIINYLSLAARSHKLFEQIRGDENIADELFLKLTEIVPERSAIAADDVAVYQMAGGAIKLLPAPQGFPSSKNELNLAIAEGNYLFDQLLEIEQELTMRMTHFTERPHSGGTYKQTLLYYK